MQPGNEGVGVSVLSSPLPINGAGRGCQFVQSILLDVSSMEVDEETEVGWIWS